MCDNDIHQGPAEDWSITRRTLIAAGIAAGMSTAAGAATPGVVEKDVKIKTPDGVCDAVLLYPEGPGTWAAVLMWPDIMGLRPVFREMGKRLAADGYVVLVPNPFYRSKPAPVVDGSFDFSNPQARQTLFGYRGAMTDAGIDTDAIAYIAFLDAQAQTAKRKKVGVQGYCMGGPLSFRTAAAVPDRIGVVASFHGGGLVSETPASPHLLIPKTKAAYLVAIARNDDAARPKEKDVLKETFAAAARPARVEVYPADHGWCVPGSAAYDMAAAERAWETLRALYKANLF